MITQKVTVEEDNQEAQNMAEGEVQQHQVEEQEALEAPVSLNKVELQQQKEKVYDEEAIKIPTAPERAAEDNTMSAEDLGYEPAQPTLAASLASPRRRRTSELIETAPDDVASSQPTTAAADRRSMLRHNRHHSELMEIGQEPKNPHHKHRRSSIAPDPFEISYHPTLFALYKPPRQRQRWGQQQILPRVNWGDLFFDLFYVASAYNTSNILVEAPSATGFLYFLGTFFSVKNVWVQKMGYDARFVVEDDLYHRFFEVAALAALASAVVHIGSVEVLSHPSKYIDMFALSLSLSICQFFSILRFVELSLAGKGQRHILKALSLKEGLPLMLGLVLQLVATVIAGVAYFGSDDNDSHRLLAEAAEPYGDEGYAGADSNITAAYGDGDNYGADIKYEVTHVPIWCLLFVLVSYWCTIFVRVVFFFPNDGSHKNFTVPMNVNFVIHRDGEWTMLMMGESILSLLIVDVPQESSDYFATFYCSLLTVIFLQYLHFRSQPHDADDHVLRRSKDRGMFWQVLWHAYSVSLIALGAAFTLFVLSFSYNTEEEDDSHRWLSEHGRGLAGGGTSPYPAEEMKQRAAHIFSIAFASVFFALDGMSLMHVGFKHGQERCYCKKKNRANNKGAFLVFIRLGLIAFVATLSQWVTDPEVLTEIGLGLTLIQVLLRRLSERYLDEDMEHLSEREESVTNSKDLARIPEEEEPQVIACG